MTYPYRSNLVKVAVVSLCCLLAVALGSPAQADEGKEIKFVSVSWTGVTVKTELAVKILDCLGYKASNLMTSVPIAYKAMASKEADAFFGNWMPSMESIAKKYFDAGTVEQFCVNMPGAQYTLAVPTYEAEAGLKDFKDIAKFGDKLDFKIHGIEEGNDGNQIIQAMIDKNMFGLGKFELIPSSEVAMLSEVMSRAKKKEWIVFLGWAPHHMNDMIDMTYLTGSTAETFGPDNGMATVYTNTRAGFAKDHPNVAKLLKNMTFPIDMMNQIMTTLHNNKDLKPREAGLQWIQKHPDVYKKWLDGVTTADGKPGLAAVEACLSK